MNSVAVGPTAASGSCVGRPALPDGRGLGPLRPGGRESRAGEDGAPTIGVRDGVPGDWSAKIGKSRVAGCLDAIGELVSRVSEEDLSGLSGDELLADAEALAKLLSRLGAVRGRMLLAIDKRRSWRSSGTRTLTQWNEKASGQSPAAASRDIKRAQALESDLRRLSAALTDGEIFLEHVDAVRRVFSTPALKEKLTEDGVQDELDSAPRASSNGESKPAPSPTTPRRAWRRKRKTPRANPLPSPAKAPACGSQDGSRTRRRPSSIRR